MRPQMPQDMWAPEHRGDLILPWAFGHSEIWTVEPSYLVRLASTRASSQWSQMASTDMLQLLQV